ncbi:MAG: Cna B-type domain-containing protein [Clostridia bacterium]|nr:Cna B-type domain-containing protein [Clostridia bacterium]
MKKITLIIAMLMALILTAGAAFASPVIDPEAQGSITVNLLDSADDHKPIPGATFRLYHVADIAEGINLAFVYTEAFEGCPASLDDVNAPGLADAVLEYAEANSIPYITGVTDENGSVTFADLELGLYLIAQEGEVEGYYPIAPFLVSVPMTNPEGTAWVYDIDASPKAEAAPIVTPEPVFRTFTVRKIWDDNDDAQHFRPASIQVKFYKDGEYVETVTLNEGNGWTYTWEGLEDGHSYTVEEVVPQNYIASYVYGADVVTITNTAKLIQTGQLNWPIPVLMGAGAVLLVIGFIIAIGKKRKNDA